MSRPRFTTGISLLLAVLLSAPAIAQDAVENTSYVTGEGLRVLRHEAVVHATAEDVWTAFTTSRGLRSFVAPVAAIDFGVGGRWEASYDPGADIGDPGNIVNEVIAYLPGEMLAIRVAQAPPDFPYPDLIRRVSTVIELEPVGSDRTRVVTTMVGWGAGPAWDRLYGTFERDNAIVLRRLRKRFRSGPIDWAAVYAERSPD